MNTEAPEYKIDPRLYLVLSEGERTWLADEDATEVTVTVDYALLAAAHEEFTAKHPEYKGVPFHPGVLAHAMTEQFNWGPVEIVDLIDPEPFLRRRLSELRDELMGD